MYIMASSSFFPTGSISDAGMPGRPVGCRVADCKSRTAVGAAKDISDVIAIEVTGDHTLTHVVASQDGRWSDDMDPAFFYYTPQFRFQLVSTDCAIAIPDSVMVHSVVRLVDKDPRGDMKTLSTTGQRPTSRLEKSDPISADVVRLVTCGYTRVSVS